MLVVLTNVGFLLNVVCVVLKSHLLVLNLAYLAQNAKARDVGVNSIVLFPNSIFFGIFTMTSLAWHKSLSSSVESGEALILIRFCYRRKHETKLTMTMGWCQEQYDF